MKTLFEFSVAKPQEVEVKEVSTNEAGQEVTIVKKEKQFVTHKFAIRKPSRNMIDDANLYYAIQFNKAIQAGLLTRAQLHKRFDNDGGTLSEDEKVALGQAYYNIIEKQEKLKLLLVETEEKQDKAGIETLQREIIELKQFIQEHELRQSSPYNHSAEVRARNKTIYWWVLFLAYKLNEKGEYEPFFGNGPEEERSRIWTDLEETEDPFITEVISRFVYFISFWQVGQANSKEAFEALAKDIEPAK